MARFGYRVGAVLVSVGLASVGIGLALPVAATPSPPVDVCSNQQGTTSDCAEPAPVGGVTTEVRDGGVVFRITAAPGTTWNRVALCIPGATPSPANDCDTTSPSVLSPADGDYAVTGVSELTTSATGAGFACTGSLQLTVPRETLSGLNSPFPWALELGNCAGGSDEAFGSVTRGAPSSADYECTGATGVSSTGATLGASTTDAAVTAVEFVLTKGATATLTDTDGSDGFSARFTGLTPNTVFAYTARFLSASGEKVESEAGCAFATPAGATTTTTSTSTTSTSTTSTTSTSTTSTTVASTSTSTTGPETTTTTAAGATTTTVRGGSTTTTIGESVLPATLTRSDAPGAVVPIAGAVAPAGELAASGAAAAPAQLARTGSSTSPLTTVGVLLIALGALALFVARTRRPGELLPAPIDHPRVPLGASERPSVAGPRRVVVRDHGRDRP